MTPNIVPATVNPKKKITVGSRIIPAPPKEIFNLLADPAQHPLLDGSGTVTGSRAALSARLSKGAKFGMNMKIVVPYRISNTVSEFEEPNLIEWHHMGGHRWRYELQAVEGGTRVTESFNWGKARIPSLYYTAMGFPERHRNSIDGTLERLYNHFA